MRGRLKTRNNTSRRQESPRREEHPGGVFGRCRSQVAGVRRRCLLPCDDESQRPLRSPVTSRWRRLSDRWRRVRQEGCQARDAGWQRKLSGELTAGCGQRQSPRSQADGPLADGARVGRLELEGKGSSAPDWRQQSKKKRKNSKSKQYFKH